MITRIVLVILGCFLSVTSHGAERSLAVIPTPQRVEYRAGACVAIAKQPVVLGVAGGLSSESTEIRWLREELGHAWQARFGKKYKKGLSVKYIHIVLDSTRVWAQKICGRDYLPEMLSEGYFLAIGRDTIDVVAPTRRGVFYGIATLVQLVRAYQFELPAVLITDYPQFSWRGISDDLARGQVATRDNFKKVIRYLAENKYNIYMPYLEDLLRLSTYPQIGAGRGALSQAEIRELQDYARQWHIEVIPICQTLGHFENILNQVEFMPHADYPGAASLNVLSDSARQFLFNMLDEIIPWFDTPYFHIGADESWDVGMGATREAAARLGIAKLHADHYQKVYQKVREHGKAVLMYGDVILRHPEILSQIPKDIQIVDWHYLPADDYPSVKQLADSGFQVLVSPAVHSWHNPFPNVAYTWLNIANIARVGCQQGARGLIVSTWGDFGCPNFRELNYIGYAYGAEASWNPVGARYESLGKYFGQQYFGLDDERFESLIWHLNEISNQTNFKEIWRQPFYATDEPVHRLLTRALLLQQHTDIALKLISELQPKAIRNAADFDYWAFGARIGNWMAHKLLVARELAATAERLKKNPTVPVVYSALEAQLSEQIYSLTALEGEYQNLWLRANRPENLSRVINLFRRQRAYYEEAREQLSVNKLDFPTELSAKFITVPGPAANDKTSPVYLRKSFELSDASALQAANLQLIANSDATIYVNGQPIGRVVATRTLSLMVENQRVGWWEVKPYLTNGKNWLTVVVRSYRPQPATAANVYLELTYENGTKRVVQSDTDWEAATSVKTGWEAGTDRDSAWQKAIAIDKWPWTISAPLFNRGFASRIEF